MNFFRKDMVYVFGEDHINTLFTNYHDSTSHGVIIVANKKYQLMHPTWILTGFDFIAHYLLIKKFHYEPYHVSLIIVVYSAVDPDSYEYVRKWWDLSIIKHCSPTAPIILVGCNADQRNDIEKSTKQKLIISEKMGVQLARRIKAVKFLECPGYDVTDLKSINQKLVRVSARNRMRPIHAVVMGMETSGKTEMIQRFVQGDRLNVLDECLNGELYHCSKSHENAFSSFIEIDGEEHDLLILDATLTDHKLRKHIPSYNQDFFKPNYLIVDVIVITFSAIDRGNFDSLQMQLEDVMCDISGKLFEIQFPVILVGIKTDLTNYPETLSNQGNDPITYETGELLAREMKAVKYLECSSSDGKEVEKVFEEVVWASLRCFEKERKTLIQKEKGFLKRFFQWLF